MTVPTVGDGAIERADDEPSSGKLLADYVAQLLKDERERGESIESRSRTVISSSGALVTLLLALAAIGSKTTVVTISAGARAFVGSSVGAFALSAVLAFTTAIPQTAHLVDPARFSTEIRAAWERSEASALTRITATRIQELADVQRANTRKAWLVLVAVSFEALAVLLLAAAVVWTTTG